MARRVTSSATEGGENNGTEVRGLVMSKECWVSPNGTPSS